MTNTTDEGGAEDSGLQALLAGFGSQSDISLGSASALTSLESVGREILGLL